MDDLEGEVVCEKLHEGGLGEGDKSVSGDFVFYFSICNAFVTRRVIK
jgi:hypothetical protein